MDIKENIAKKIESGSLKMRPRAYFVMKSILAILGGTVLALVLLYLGSFAFYARLPLIPLLAAVLAAWGLERFLYNYAPAYRWPIAYSFGLIVFLALIGSFELREARVHERLHRYVRDRDVPIFAPFYNHFGPIIKEEFLERQP
jgi:hypothetical protein